MRFIVIAIATLMGGSLGVWAAFPISMAYWHWSPGGFIPPHAFFIPALGALGLVLGAYIAARLLK
jgi:hypothetical protein